MNDSLPSNIIQEFVHPQSDILDHITSATIPLYVSLSGGELQPERSSVLLKIDSEYFLLTATHELLNLNRPEVRFFTQPRFELSAPFELTGRKVEALTGVADIAIVRLNPGDIAGMSPNAKPVLLSQLDLDTSDDMWNYFVSGYPCEWQRPKHLADGSPHYVPLPFTLFTDAFTGELEKPKDFNQKCHIAVTWPKEFEGTDNGQTVTLRTPNPKGMSGCGIWKLGSRSAKDPISRQQKYTFRLSAIQHSAHRGRNYAKGTRVTFALYLIGRTYPDLRATIETQFPNTFEWEKLNSIF